MIQSARRDGSGVLAGLSANDVIVAIDGLKATAKLVEKYAKQDGTYIVYAFRRDEFIQFEIQGAEIDLTTVELNIVDQAKVDGWLKV